MTTGPSVAFFDTHFGKQLDAGELSLNPFERRALPYARGETLDYGCGLGNFSVAAAGRGCRVLALDASPVAIQHLRAEAGRMALPITASQEDLRCYEPAGSFDTVACIGLLMFFDCPTADLQLKRLQDVVRAGGVMIVNVLVQGTTYMDMFDPAAHCLFRRNELVERFAGWEVLEFTRDDFPAPGNLLKSFETLVARKTAA